MCTQSMLKLIHRKSKYQRAHSGPFVDGGNEDVDKS